MKKRFLTGLALVASVATAQLNHNASWIEQTNEGEIFVQGLYREYTDHTETVLTGIMPDGKYLKYTFVDYGQQGLTNHKSDSYTIESNEPQTFVYTTDGVYVDGVLFPEPNARLYSHYLRDRINPFYINRVGKIIEISQGNSI